MEKKTECEIVQDLLLGYVDDVLNMESKKLVEKHLAECEVCQKKLKDLKSDVTENEKNQKKEIDYLKKIRRKSKIKSVIIAIEILLFIFLMWYLRQFIIVQSITNKSEKALQSNNFYKEKRSFLSDGEVSVWKTYYKDGKYKRVWEMYVDDKKQIKDIQYSSEGTEETITILPEENKVKIETGEITKLMNQANSKKSDSYYINSNGIDSLIAKLGMAWCKSIHTDTYEIGREYYVIRDRFDKSGHSETWIDKDTGLTLKNINRNSVRHFIPGTDIVKSEEDMIEEFSYEFDVVTDEDVAIPDLSGYEIEYVDTNIIM